MTYIVVRYIAGRDTILDPSLLVAPAAIEVGEAMESVVIDASDLLGSRLIVDEIGWLDSWDWVVIPDMLSEPDWIVISDMLSEPDWIVISDLLSEPDWLVASGGAVVSDEPLDSDRLVASGLSVTL